MLPGKGLLSSMGRVLCLRGLSVSAPSDTCDLSTRLSSFIGSHVDFRIYINLGLFNDKRGTVELQNIMDIIYRYNIIFLFPTR